MRWKSVGVRVQKRDRATESKNHIYFKGEMAEQDTKCTSEWSFLKMLQQWSRVFLPEDVTSAASWHLWWQTAFHRLAYSAQWHGSSWWISLSGAVGTGRGCCRKTGFFLKMPGFHLVSDNSLHLKSLLNHPVLRTRPGGYIAVSPVQSFVLIFKKWNVDKYKDCKILIYF